MLLASRFEVCFSLTFCLFDVFMTERALDTVSVSPFLDAILFLMYMFVNVVAVDGTFCL